MDSAKAYETHAHEFLRGRDTSPIGAVVVDQWSRTLRRGATVIELACGGGYPITRALEAAGLQVWAGRHGQALLLGRARALSGSGGGAESASQRRRGPVRGRPRHVRDRA